GLLLGRWLFGEEVGRLFRDALAATPDGGDDDRLHILLSLEAPSLRGLNWERLCGPVGGPRDGGWDYLGLHQRTPYAVYVAGTTGRRFPPVGFSALRVLLVVASPEGADDAPPFGATAVRDGLRQALDSAAVPCDVLARGDGAVAPPTLDN